MACGSKSKKRKSRGGIKYQKTETPPNLITRLPQICSNCGAKIDNHSVKWVSSSSVECEFCGLALPVEFQRIA